jgi:hypothetical protein
MASVVWLMLLGAVGGAGYMVWKWHQRWQERQRAADARFASVLAQARPAEAKAPAAPPAPASTVPLQKLLFEAASKAGEAGEPALSIQLYARLLARYPDSTLGAQARAAVEEQKRKLATPKAPGTSAPG